MEGYPGWVGKLKTIAVASVFHNYIDNYILIYNKIGTNRELVVEPAKRFPMIH